MSSNGTRSGARKPDSGFYRGGKLTSGSRKSSPVKPGYQNPKTLQESSSEQSFTARCKDMEESSSVQPTAARCKDTEENTHFLEYLGDDSDVTDDDESNFEVDILGNKVRPTRQALSDREASRKRKLEVIRGLLEGFNLQETLDKYQSMEVKQYRIQVNQFSSQCSVAAIALRQRLINLTGSDVIRMNDSTYMDELRRKRIIEYDLRMDRQEEAREESERNRMRRLLKEKMITPDQLKDDPLFQQEYNRMKMKYGRTRPNRRRSPNKNKRAQTASVVEGRNKDPRPTDTSRSKTVLNNKPSDCPPPQSTRTQERPKTVTWESRHDRHRYKESRNTEDSDDGDIDYTRWSGYNKYNDPLILKLQDEHSVDGLYDIAEEILDGKLPSQRGLDRQKTSKLS